MILFDRPKINNRRRVVSSSEIRFASTTTSIDGYDPIKISRKNISKRPELRANRISTMGDQIIRKLSSSSQVSIASSGESLSFPVISRMLRTQVVSFCVGLITSTIRSLPFSVKCDDPLIRQIVQKTLDQHYSEIIDGMVTAYYNGYSFAQKRIEKRRVIFSDRNEDGDSEIVFDDTLDMYQKIKFIDPLDSRISYNYNVKEDEIHSIEQTNGQNVTTVPRSDLVWMSYGSPFRKVFGRSKFVDIYTPWELLNIFSRYALEETDRNASPPVQVMYPYGYTRVDGESIDNKEIAYQIAQDVVTSVAFAIPSSRQKDGELEWSVDVVKDWVTSGYESIRKQIEFANTLIALGLGVPPQLSPFSTRTGASGAGEVEVGLEMLMLSIEPMVDDIRSAIITDVIDPIIAMNVRDENLVPYQFDIDKTIFNRRQLAKEVLINQLQVQGQMMTSGQGVPGYVVDISSLLRHLGIPITQTQEAYPELQDLQDLSNVDQNPNSSQDGIGEGPLKDKLQNDKDNGINRKTKRPSRAGKKSGVIAGA